MSASTHDAAMPSADACTTSRELTVPAEDGTQLAATLFEPAAAPAADAPLVVIAPAVGDPRRYYARFAAYLAERGPPVLTFDYRGIGGSRRGSLKGSPVRMRDWCILDVPGVLAWARAHLSASGRSTGSATAWAASPPASPTTTSLIARQLNVATLSGYWGRMAAPERYRVRRADGLRSPPVVVRAMGYFPGVLMGGEDMPGPAFLEWTRWCMTPEFLFGDATLPERSNFAQLHARRCAASRSPTTPGARRPPSATWPSISPPASTARSGGSRPPKPASPRSATSASSARRCATRCGRRRGLACSPAHERVGVRAAASSEPAPHPPPLPMKNGERGHGTAPPI